MATTVTTSGFDRIRESLRALAADLRQTSAKAVEIAPASADVVKAEALVRDGRDVFAVDAALEHKLADVFDAELSRQGDLAASGRRGSVAAAMVKMGDAARTEVVDRINDAVETPGGKAPLKRPRRDGSTDHIGKSAAPLGGALASGLVVRLVGR